MIKLKYIALIFILFFSMNNIASASSISDFKTPIDIKVNNKYIKCDVKPFMISGSTYVPIRFVSEALQADEVSWNLENQTATIKYSGIEINLPVGENYAYVNNSKVEIANGVKLIDGRTFVPVRFISENFGATVSWDGNYFIVSIDKEGISVPENLIDIKKYTTEDIFWLARIIEAESSGEPLQGKIAVGNVVLNRVESGQYPNSIYEVIFDRQNGVQFQPVLNRAIYNVPSYDSVVAAKYVINGKNIVGDCLFFLNPTISTSFWITNNRQYYTTIGNHSFYL